MSKKPIKLDCMQEADIKNVLNGLSYPIYSAKKDSDTFTKYKNGEVDDLSEYTLKEMEILSILEKLGYPLYMLGTYLYKELVMYTYEEIKDFKRNKDKDKAENLLRELNIPYSNLYHIIARDDLEIGIKSFHYHICNAIDEINESKIDNSLAEKIFGKNPVESNYGVQAFKIASYLSKKYMIKYSDTKVKKLTDDIR